MLCVALDQGFDERRLADSWRTDNGDDDGGSLFRQTVHKGDMEAFLFDLEAISGFI